MYFFFLCLASSSVFLFCPSHYFCPLFQIFPGLILSDIKPAKRMKFKTVCYLLVQLMHCRKMFKAEIPFSNVMTCEDDDKVGKNVSDRSVCVFSCVQSYKDLLLTIKKFIGQLFSSALNLFQLYYFSKKYKLSDSSFLNMYISGFIPPL